MKSVAFSLVLFTASLNWCMAQVRHPYWQQQADFQIKVALLEKEKSLIGSEQISYSNNSPDTLYFIWMHCWPNAYKNDKTAFSEQLLINNRTDFYFSRENERGYINQLQFTVDDKPVAYETHPQHQDIIRLPLPKPLLPGQSITIRTPFHIKLPHLFSRMGYKEGFFAITQWYPKPAVYDKDGWHPMPYLDQGEFYSEFGNYTVSITVPDGMQVAATGVRRDSAANITGLAGEKMKTLVFKQDSVHDFAWFAARKFIILSDSLLSISGKVITVKSYYPPQHKQIWKLSTAYIKSAVQYREKLIGEYPYTIVQAVDGFQGENSGGMEYPTITVINENTGEKELETTIAHEIGHNWFYGALATNERSYPWMDEGFNSYYDRRYENAQPKPQESVHKNFLAKRIPADPEAWLLRGLESIHRDQPIQTPSEALNAPNYGMVAYYKTSVWLRSLEKEMGTRVFDSAMMIYYRKYFNKHPTPGQFQQVFDSVSGKKLATFDQLNRTGSALPMPRKKIRPAFLFDFSQHEKYHTIGISPAPGFNNYDGFMAGILLHNHESPLPRFRFLIAPLYGTKSKTLAGLANINYSWFPGNSLQSVEAGFNFSKFTGDEFHIEQGSWSLQYQKISPYLKFTINERNPLSKKERYLMMKSFFFKEDELFSNYVVDGADTSLVFSKGAAYRNLHQLKLYLADHRKLYPYELEAVAEYQKEFTRLTLAGQYFFNYNTQNDGLQLRFFAGKFLYNTGRTPSKEIKADRYMLNLTGANGYEDYTYSNYFAGRNEFTGWMSQQIMLRDGGFKVRTDLYSSKIGKTDNWLAAINLNSTIPPKYNPLALLPVKIPLKLFADLGTYAEAWDKESESSKILFDAGLQLSMFRDILNIYIPVINSTVFRDYNNSVLGEKKFWKTISFSVDIQKLSSRKLLAKMGL